jgi:hypothetical protein
MKIFNYIKNKNLNEFENYNKMAYFVLFIQPSLKGLNFLGK